MISLHPLNRLKADAVLHIAVRPDQEKFGGTVAAALAEPETTVDLHEIRQGDYAVGLFKIDRAYHPGHDFAAPTDLGLRGMILDHSRQGLGLGSAAMVALKTYLPPRYPDRRRVWLTVNLGNPAAIAVYRKAGFADTGEIWLQGRAGPQMIMFMSLE